MKNIEFLLKYLERNRGRRLPLSAFGEFLRDRKENNQATGNSPGRKEKRSGERSRGSGKKSAQPIPFEIRKELQALSEMGLLQIRDNEIMISPDFLVEAEISVARSGIAFGVGNFDGDIFIAPQAKAGARHRDKVAIRITGHSRNRYEGEVIRIVKRFTTSFIAQVTESSPGQSVIRLPDQPDDPVGIIDGQYETGQVLLVRETDRVTVLHSRKREKIRPMPAFRVIREIDPESLDSDLDRIVIRYNLPEEYPADLIPDKKTLLSLEKQGMKDKNRRDLMHLYAVTIDGADAKDFDDAISLEETREGVRLYVHIADVSWYVTQNSPLDKEALRRSNSYYLSKRVLPMLPPVLSEEFCSLKPRTKRLVFTCELEYDTSGKLLRFQFYRSKIKLSSRFTYESAQKEIGKKGSRLSKWWLLAEKLLASRMKSGRIDLILPEMMIQISKNGELAGFATRERLNSHRLIEEFMLSANEAAARLAREHKIGILHRNHEPIPGDALPDLNDFLAIYGFKERLRDLEPESIAALLPVIQKSEVSAVFQIFLLRSFAQANYAPEQLGHWGLAFGDYAHFTSPIRRYADLVLHRALTAWLDKRPAPYDLETLSSIGREVSRNERLAMEAERGMHRLLGVRFLKDQIGHTFHARLSGITNSGLYIILEESGLEGFIPVSDFSRQSETEAHSSFSVRLPKFSKVIYLGTRIKVTLYETDWLSMSLKFHLEELIS